MPNTKKKDNYKDQALLGGKLLGGGALLYGAGHGMLSNNGARDITNFTNASTDQWSQGQDFRDNVKQYAELGHKAIAAKPFGVPGNELMEAIRQPDVLQPLSHLSGYVKNNYNKLVVAPGSGEHYDTFSKSPLDGYLVLQKELANNGHPGATATLQGIRDKLKYHLLGNMSYDESHDFVDKLNIPSPMEKAVSRDLGVNRATDSFQGLMNDTQTSPMNHVFHNLPSAKYDNSYYDKMTGYAKSLAGEQNMNLDTATSEQKTDLFHKFDGYIRQHDTDFWKQKQYADWAMGREVVNAGSTYSPIAHLFTNPSNALKYTGMGLGAAGVGLGGYALYKMLKQHLAKKKVQQA